MILTKPQAVACAYALDTSELSVHIAIGCDIDVQKLPSGQVTVNDEFYPSLPAFISHYEIPMPSKPLADIEAQLKARELSARYDTHFWKLTGLVGVVCVLILAAVEVLK